MQHNATLPIVDVSTTQCWATNGVLLQSPRQHSLLIRYVQSQYMMARRRITQAMPVLGELCQGGSSRICWWVLPHKSAEL